MIEKNISSLRGATYYWISENQSGKTVVFLHGLSANHHLFDKQTEAFSGECRVIAWDAPAHGKSRPYEDFSYSNAAEELKSILAAESVEQAVLVGQSAGGFVAQSFYRKYPQMVAGIVTIGTSPYGSAYYSSSDLFWLRQTKWMFGLYPDGYLRRAMAKACGDTEHARENMLSMQADYSKDELCKLLYIGFAGFIPEICELDIKCPVYLMVGEHDKTGKVMTYNKKWHEKEGFPLYIIDNAAHNANDDNPQRFNQLLDQFLHAL